MLEADYIYRMLFAHPRVVRDLLVAFVPGASAATFDWASLRRRNASGVSDAGRVRHADMVWTVGLAGLSSEVLILLEFQSVFDRWMPLRVQGYAALLCQELVRQQELSSNGKLPVILPLVLYSGQRRWTTHTDLAELQEIAPQSFRAWQPAQRFVLVDEGAYDDQLSELVPNVAGAIFCLEHASSVEEMLRVGEWLHDELNDGSDRTLRADLALMISTVLRRKVRDDTIADTTDLRKILNMLAERRLDWWEMWKAEGRAEGRTEGEAKLLLRQLARRFAPLPEWVQTKLGSASEDDLMRWGDNSVDAQSLEQVFER